MGKRYAARNITRNIIPALRDGAGRFTAYGKIQVALDYIARGMDQRTLREKYQCSITTINHLLRPGSIAEAVMRCKITPEVVGADEISVISSWLKKRGKVIARTEDPEIKTGEAELIKEQSNLVSSLGSAAAVAARGLILSVALLSKSLQNIITQIERAEKNAKDEEEINKLGIKSEEVCKIAHALKGLFSTLAPFNTETAETISRTKHYEMNNTVLSVTNMSMSEILNAMECDYKKVEQPQRVIEAERVEEK